MFLCVRLLCEVVVWYVVVFFGLIIWLLICCVSLFEGLFFWFIKFDFLVILWCNLVIKECFEFLLFLKSFFLSRLLFFFFLSVGYVLWVFDVFFLLVKFGVLNDECWFCMFVLGIKVDGWILYLLEVIFCLNWFCEEVGKWYLFILCFFVVKLLLFFCLVFLGSWYDNLLMIVSFFRIIVFKFFLRVLFFF